MDKVRIEQKIAHFSKKLEIYAEALESFVEKKVLDKDQLDQHLKSIVDSVEKKIKQTMGPSFESETNAKVPLKLKTWDHFHGDLPKYESQWASGFDVRAQINHDIQLEPGDREMIPTGLSFEIPLGYEIQARPRSGLAAKFGITLMNTPGTIDADYRGEVKIILANLGKEGVVIKPQDRIAQLVLCPVIQAEFERVRDLSDTDRGAGGFGSTGV